MGLRKCSSCKRRMPKKALFCPYCGNQIPEIDLKKRKQRRKRLICITALLLVVVLAVWLYVTLLPRWKYNKGIVAEKYESFTVEGARAATFRMVFVEGGSFSMGAMAWELEDDFGIDEEPVHEVMLSDYYIGETEVTQTLWKAVMGKNPSWFKGDNLPVERVSWEECQAFIAALNELCAGKLGGRRFALPTEAQWEYAARGGNKSQGYKYCGSNSLYKVAWYRVNSGRKTHPVATKCPNELGIYDMSGNVLEWCSDWYGDYNSSSQTNPTGPNSGSSRVRRGGSWFDLAGSCRSSLRFGYAPVSGRKHLGLRLALVPVDNDELTPKQVPEKRDYATSQGPSVPTGALPGRFAINADGDQVYFSQGNLQYQASTNTWRFAEHQWDYVGDANSNISSSYDGWIDLFGWGASGYKHGATCYQPWSTSIQYSDYYAYGSDSNSLYDQTGRADWGYNCISNGGNAENQWRTLTGGSNSEWSYVLYTRGTDSGIRYAKGQVNGVNGVILVPDDWSASTYALSTTNSIGASYASNIISQIEWTSVLEPAGCVFLPAAGYRSGTMVSNMGSYGYYWSSSCNLSDSAYRVYFTDINGSLYAGNSTNSRCNGLSVRLVRDAR